MSDQRLLDQTPGGSGRWDDIWFTLEDRPTDYVIVLNRPQEPLSVRVRPSRVWGLIQEPPNQLYAPMHRGQRAFAKILTSDERLRQARYVRSHPALPWFVEKSYDDLSTNFKCLLPDKKDAVCCVTSANVMFKGHVQRLQMLRDLRENDKVLLEVFGRGIRRIDTKWDVLSRYKYALVLENHVSNWYWSEKLADCFLAGTFPFYIGCPRIGSYFPADALLLLNGRSAEEIGDQIRAAMARRTWENSLGALAEARDRVLNQYSMFPYLAGLVRAHERSGVDQNVREEDVTIHSVTPHLINAWTRSRLRAAYVNTRAAIGCPLVDIRTL
jgi:hypothetical protein